MAQKLAIHQSQRYKYGQLMEVNAHSLFSKYFSESGKLVLKVFSKIREIVEDDDCFVCILLDEVESLTAARQVNSNEPSDAIRVVNAVLTQLDSLRRFKNVLILATSNITDAIDDAFVDRADIKLHVGLPTVGVRYGILASALNELMRVGIISPREELLDLRDVMLLRDVQNEATRPSLCLGSVAELCEGRSCRSLRKLPFLAHSLLVSSGSYICTLQNFIDALRAVIIEQNKAAP